MVISQMIQLYDKKDEASTQGRCPRPCTCLLGNAKGYKLCEYKDSNKEDILSVMQYVGQQLAIRWHRAREIKCVAEETFSALITSWKGEEYYSMYGYCIHYACVYIGVLSSEQTVKKWVDEESILGVDKKSSISK